MPDFDRGSVFVHPIGIIKQSHIKQHDSGRLGLVSHRPALILPTSLFFPRSFANTLSISKYTRCLTSTDTIRLIRDGEKGARWYGGAGRGRVYTYRYTVTTWMTSAWRWAAMRAILMFHNCEGQSHKTVSADHNLWRERRAEANSNRGPSAYQPTALPLGQTGSQLFRSKHWFPFRRDWRGRGPKTQIPKDL